MTFGVDTLRLDVVGSDTKTLELSQVGINTMISIGLGLTSTTILGRGLFSPASLFRNGEVGAWFDPSPETTFTDTAGTTPATVGQAVALMLDKSQGLVLGPELVTNGTFDSADGWALTRVTIGGGVADYSQNTDGASQATRTDVTTVSGKTYLVTFEASANQITTGFLLAVGGTFYAVNIVAGVNQYRVVAGPTPTDFRLRANIANVYTGTFDNISVRELPGLHATQPTAAARPILARVPASGRRNILVGTATLATQTRVVTAAQHTLSFRGTGTVTLTGASISGPLVGTGADDIVLLTFTPTAGNLTLTVLGTVNDAQLELGAVRTAYQLVGATTYDVTEAGQADNWYLFDDLVDDAINWTAPSDTYSIAFISTGGAVTILSGQALSGATDVLRASRTGPYIAADRAWTAKEQAQITAYLEGLGSGL